MKMHDIHDEPSLPKIYDSERPFSLNFTSEQPVIDTSSYYLPWHETNNTCLPDLSKDSFCQFQNVLSEDPFETHPPLLQSPELVKEEPKEYEKSQLAGQIKKLLRKNKRLSKKIQLTLEYIQGLNKQNQGKTISSARPYIEYILCF